MDYAVTEGVLDTNAGVVRTSSLHARLHLDSARIRGLRWDPNVSRLTKWVDGYSLPPHFREPGEVK